MNEIADGIFFESGFEGVNVGVLVTDQMLIYIDAPSYPRDARYWTTQIERLYPGRNRYVVLTDYNGDRILNSRWLQAPLICHKETAERINSYDKRYPQKLLDSLYRRNPAAGKELSSSPVDKASVSFSSRLAIEVAPQDIFLNYFPGPTNGNLLVDIPASKVMFAGDTIVCDTFPPLGEICTHSWLESLESFEHQAYKGYKVVPGRGSITDCSSGQSMAQFIRKMKAAVSEFINRRNKIEDIGLLADQFVNYFPSSELPEDWLLMEITRGLERIYNECLTSHNPFIEEINS